MSDHPYFPINFKKQMEGGVLAQTKTHKKQVVSSLILFFLVLCFIPSPAQGQENPEPEQEAETQDVEPPSRETICDDQIDNDSDTNIDCDDFDCVEAPNCLTIEGLPSPNSPTPERLRATQPAEAEPDITIEEVDNPERRERSRDQLLDVLSEPPPEEEQEESIFELHGYFRLRGDIFHNIHMTQSSDGGYSSGQPGFSQYPSRPSGDGQVECEGNGPCRNSTFASTNMRFRLEPIINLSRRVRVLGQIDMLDNLVLGSTPQGSSYGPLGGATPSYLTSLRYYSRSQSVPNDRNSLSNALSVRRFWTELDLPIGTLKFGRMGSHWGMGILQNSGNRVDDDYGDSVDRISLTTRIWGLYLEPGAEFVDSGATTQYWTEFRGQPLDAGQLDDIIQYYLILARWLPEDEQAERLRRQEVIINGGLSLSFRNQVLSQELSNIEPGSPFVHRNAWALIPDLWFQMFIRGFHLEFEFAFVGGKVGNTSFDDPDVTETIGADLRQFGMVIRGDYTFLDGRFNVGLEFGFASGDQEFGFTDGTNVYEAMSPRQTRRDDLRATQFPGYPGSSVNSLFAFDPDYNVDLILFEQILGTVAGAYYFKPWVTVEILRDVLGLSGSVIVSLASEPLQTVGNNSVLGLEVNLSFWFTTGPPGNFTAHLMYGILFPFSGWEDAFNDASVDLEQPQTLQGVLSIAY